MPRKSRSRKSRRRRSRRRMAGWRCEICCSNGPLEEHHIIPLSMGGAWDSQSNIQVICNVCHCHIHGFTVSADYHSRRVV